MFRLLDLSVKEAKVFLSLRDGAQTVLDIATYTKVSRPSVYDILQKLKKRRLVQSHIVNGKKSWSIASEKELSDTLYETKKAILGFVDGKDEVGGVTDGVVTVHRGKEAVKKALMSMIRERKNERFLCYTPFSDILDKGWLAILTLDEINEWNRIVKKNGIIS